MSEFLRRKRDCQIGIKAAQNLKGALGAFEKLCSNEIRDDVIRASLFSNAVVRYGRPFAQTKLEEGRTRYPLARVNNSQGFSSDLHEHLVLLRNTLVAHDDVSVIEPRLLFKSIKVAENDVTIPIAMAISNKCLSYPESVEDIQKMKIHVEATLRAVAHFLSDDLKELRAFVIANPHEVPKPSFQENRGAVDVPVEGMDFHFRDFSDEAWLVIKEPDFSLVENGFHYEQIRAERSFPGPEVIKLANGDECHITPHGLDSTQRPRVVL
jgi:hypothetical protein